MSKFLQVFFLFVFLAMPVFSAPHTNVSVTSDERDPLELEDEEKRKKVYDDGFSFYKQDNISIGITEDGPNVKNRF